MTISEEELSRLARKYALINALEHDGKASQGAVTGRILAENPDLRKDSSTVKALAAKQVSIINEMDAAAQKATIDSEFPGELDKRITSKKQISKIDSEKAPSLPDLPDAVVGQVVTRFPPEPNGFMHIGHAKAAILGSEYAKKYSGDFILRFDDTNPAAEKREYYDAFLDSFAWIGISPTRIKNASDDLPLFYEIARKLMQNKGAYVCLCTQEVMRGNRAAGRACEHRSNLIDRNLSLWEEMLSGRIEKSDAVLRFMGDMNSLNTAMRDPVLFRIVKERHPLQGERFRVWPTYDFDGPVEDSLDGVTHAMRSKEYELRDELYYSLLKSIGLRLPRIIEFSRLQLQNTTISKRNLRKLIEEGHVSGWDDPRLATIAGLRRRGFLPQTIREFVLQMGLSKVESEPTWDLLESINRKLLDPIAKRFFFVEDPVKLTVEGAPALKASLKMHPTADFGLREIATNGEFLIASSDAKTLKAGSTVRLIDAYNVTVESISENSIHGRHAGEGNLEKVQRIQWVVPSESVPFEVMITGPLLLNEEYNPHSLRIARGRAELSVKELTMGEIFQFVRFGFCRLDKPGLAILSHK